MTRLTLIVFSVYTVIYSIEGVAESADEPQNEVNVVDEDDAEFRAGGPFASAHGQASVIPSNNIGTRPRPIPVDPNRRPVNMVSCYACSNCPKVYENSTEVKYCPMSQDPTKADKCVVYAEKFKRETIQCWSCSSDITSDCNDPFVPGFKNMQSIQLVNCDAIFKTMKKVCKKEKTIINGHVKVTRGCATTSIYDDTNQCPGSAVRLRGVTSVCEICHFDGCNSTPLQSLDNKSNNSA